MPAAAPADGAAKGRLIVLAAGKAAGSMTEVAERHYLDAGFPAARFDRPRGGAPGYGTSDPTDPRHRSRTSYARCRRTRSRRARARARRWRRTATTSCWCCCPAVHRRTGSHRSNGLDARRQAGGHACAAALRRQHRRDQHGAKTSLAHQGWPARTKRAQPARVVTLAISDVPGDDPAVIGSGPTVPDPTTLADARAIVARYRARFARRGRDARLSDPNNESPKPNDPIFATTEFKLIARPADAFRAAEHEAREARLRAGPAWRPYRGRGPRRRRRARRPGTRFAKGRAAAW